MIDSSDPGHVIATYNPLLIAVFTRIPRDEELATLRRRASEAIEQRIAGGMLYVVARKDMAGGVDPRVRAVFEDMIRKNQDDVGSSAVVVLTEGFAAAIVRGAVSSLLGLVQRRRMMRIFGAVDEACRWLAPQHGLDAGQLFAAYRRVTSHLTEIPR